MLVIRRPFSYSMEARRPDAIIIFRPRSSLSVRSSPEAVNTRTPRFASKVKLRSCTTRSPAKRLASSTMTVRTPFLSMRSRSAASPSRCSIGAAYGGVIGPVPIGNLEARAPGVGVDGGPLPALRVWVEADVSGRAGSQIRDRRRADLGHASRRQSAAPLRGPSAVSRSGARSGCLPSSVDGAKSRGSGGRATP
jgi:hypothetical protein